MASLTQSLQRTIPEFPDFTVSIPKGIGSGPEHLLCRKALEDLCNDHSFLGIDPRAFLEEQGVISMVWKPALSSLRAKLNQDERCHLQYFDLDQVRLGLCASAYLIQKHAQGVIPEPLRTNEGIREVLWLRIMRQLASDCLKHGGGSLTSSRLASEFLGVSVEQGKELIRRARNRELILVDDKSFPHSITPTPRLITLLNVPSLTKLFENHTQRSPQSSLTASSPDPLFKKKASSPPGPLEELRVPKHGMEGHTHVDRRKAEAPQRKTRTPRNDTQKSAAQFADLFDAITTVFKDSPGEWLTPVRVWNLVRLRGINPRSPGRVGQICDELKSSGLLRKSKECAFQLHGPSLGPEKAGELPPASFKGK